MSKNYELRELIKDYLESLTWDGVKRVDTLLINVFGANNTEYIKAVTRKTLSAMVQRIYKPGIKFDYCLTLIGEQGLRKSMFFNELTGNEYFSDDFSLNDTKDKTASEKTLVNWCIEIPEVAGMRKADIDTVKAFITRRIDKFRLAYGHVMEEHPRQCVFVATSNEEDGLLKDITRDRHWWLVNCNKKWNGSLNRDQIWAEVMENYRHEQLFLNDELEKEANRKDDK